MRKIKLEKERNTIKSKLEHINNIELSQQKIKPLIAYYTRGEYKKAENIALSIIEKFSSNQFVWKLLGSIYLKTGKKMESLNANLKAIKLAPNDAEAYNNLGVILLDLDKLMEAESSLNFSVKLDNNNVDGYFNLGLVQKKLGKLEESIINYKKAISLKPENFNYHGNLANTLLEKGRLRESINSFLTAIKLNPHYTKAWNNIYFPLKIISSLSNYEKEYNYKNFKQTSIKLNALRFLILDYKLNEGKKNKKVFFDKAIKQVNKTTKLNIKNIKKNENKKNIQISLPEKIISLIHFGRSGTGLLHSLIDSHSKISTIPSIYFSQYFDGSVWEKIIEGGREQVIDKFISSYPVFFDSRSPDAVPSKNMENIEYLGVKEGMTNLGKNKNEYLYIDKNLFRKELKYLMDQHNEINQFIFFKMVHVAYERTLGNTKDKDIIFYHIHAPDTYAMLNFLNYSPDSNWLMMVRNPVESCASWIANSYKDNNYNEIVMKIQTMLFEIDNIVFRNRNSIGVRLEDIKSKPKKTILKLCDWIGIENKKCLYKMTAQNKIWWGDNSSPNMPAFGNMPKSKIDNIFSLNDRFILDTLFYPFNVRFRYVEENKKKFLKDLQIIRPEIEKMFDFEKKIALKVNISETQFVKSGHFLYLRSRMIDRWNTLNEFHTYPNMITPLKV